MDISSQNPLRTRINQDGAGSVTAFAAITSGRWVMTNFALGWSNALSSCTISLYEIDSTNSAAFFLMQTSTTNGWLNLNMGEVGTQASSSYSSRMVLNIGADGTWTALFSGYSTGA